MPLHHSHALPHYLAPAEVALYRLFALDAALSCPVGMGGCLSGGLGRLWGSAVFRASDHLRDHLVTPSCQPGLSRWVPAFNAIAGSCLIC